MYRAFHNKLPMNLQRLFKMGEDEIKYNTRQSKKFRVKYRRNKCLWSIVYQSQVQDFGMNYLTMFLNLKAYLYLKNSLKLFSCLNTRSITDFTGDIYDYLKHLLVVIN